VKTENYWVVVANPRPRPPFPTLHPSPPPSKGRPGKDHGKDQRPWVSLGDVLLGGREEERFVFSVTSCSMNQTVTCMLFCSVNHAL